MKYPTNPHLPSCILTPLGKELGDLAGLVFGEYTTLQSPGCLWCLSDRTDSWHECQQSFLPQIIFQRIQWPLTLLSMKPSQCFELAFIFHRKLMICSASCLALSGWLGLLLWRFLMSATVCWKLLVKHETAASQRKIQFDTLKTPQRSKSHWG